MDKSETLIEKKVQTPPVIVTVDEQEGDSDDSYEMMDQLYGNTLKDIQEGEVVEGRVVKISAEYVLIDVGYKSEGQIPIREFQDETGGFRYK